MPDRVFTEEEVREIVRRASEQQAEDAERRQAREHGLTLADLERLGEEVGLEPAYLRAAADAVQSGRRPVVQTETQTDTHLVVERRIDTPFTPEAWEDTVAMLRQRFGLDMGTWYGNNSGGRVEQVGRAHEWTHINQWGTETRVSVSERDGQTRLLLSQRVGHASPKVEGIGYGAGIGFLVGLMGLGAGEMVGGSGALLALVLTLMLLVTLVAAPTITHLDKRWRAKKQDRLKSLAAEIERTFAEAAPAENAHAEPIRAERTSEGRLDLDALPDEVDERSGPAQRRARS